nr:helix-hairpin-helix domain-containing protein [Neobacillus fumarioli]
MVQLKEWLMEHKMYGLLVIVIAAFGLYYFFGHDAQVPAANQMQGFETKPQIQKKKTDNTKQTAKDKQSDQVMVDVKGQVKLPGVYQANQGERVNDVINRAGGLTDKADQSQVNFAEHIKDEMVIYIPAKDEVPQALPSNGNTANNGKTAASPGNPTKNQTKVNLNKADETQLQTLPGVGAAKAKAIIDYREKSGPFKKIDDLKNISGIGDKTFEKLKDLIEV